MDVPILAVSVTVPFFRAVIYMVAELEPAGIVTEAGREMIVASDDVKVTEVSEVRTMSADTVKTETVPVSCLLPKLEPRPVMAGGFFTRKLSVLVSVPIVAVTKAEPALPAVMATVALLAKEYTVALEGTLTTDALLVDREIVTSAEGVYPRPTVKVEAAPACRVVELDSPDKCAADTTLAVADCTLVPNVAVKVT